jgi:type II secretory pathway pseudopilin PulG
MQFDFTQPCSSRHRRQLRRSEGYTLAEVVVAVAILALAFGSILTAYTQATRRAQWSGYSIAAQALAVQSLEQARSAVYDPATVPLKNELATMTNLTAWTYSTNTGSGGGYWVATLDLPYSGTNYVVATNYVSVKTLWIVPNTVTVQMVRVDTVWPFNGWNRSTYYTNTIVNYFAPDNPEQL